MNRKERRAANKRRDESARRPNALAFYSAGVSIVDLAAEASRSHGMGRINEAQEICRQILAREPAHVRSLNLLGLMAQASGDHRVAVKMFAKAIASDEVNAACHYNVGNSYQALGNRTKAIAHFSKALALGMDEKARHLHPAESCHRHVWCADCRQAAATGNERRIVRHRKRHPACKGPLPPLCNGSDDAAKRAT
jgi:tetratricopeptide (TPR) repeat protein